MTQPTRMSHSFSAPTNRRAFLVSFSFLGGLLLFVIILGLWLWQGNLEESITAHGQMIPEGKLLKITAPVSGIASKVLVRENQEVKAGELMVELDPEASDIEQKTLLTQLQQLKDEASALQAAYTGNSYQTSDSSFGTLQGAWLAATRQSMQAEMHSAETEIRRLEHEYQEAIEREKQARDVLGNSEGLLQEYENLYEAGGLSRNDYKTFERDVLQQRGTLNAVREEVNARKLALAEAGHRPSQLRGNYHQNLLTRLTDIEEKISLIERDTEKARLIEERQQIKAPVDGIVHELALTNGNEYVTSGNPLISLVPKDTSLVAEVQVTNTDLGFVHIGQSARLTLDAFPFYEYGALHGKVTAISPSTKRDEHGMPFYIIRIKPDKNGFKKDGKTHPLRSGMTLTANLITREKNILSFFTEPLMKHVDRAFRDPSSR